VEQEIESGRGLTLPKRMEGKRREGAIKKWIRVMTVKGGRCEAEKRVEIDHCFTSSALVVERRLGGCAVIKVRAGMAEGLTCGKG
jgi:hypothetical protein